MSNHTPGPWQAEPDDEGWRVTSTGQFPDEDLDKNTIAEVWYGGADSERDANTLLIMRAPELYDLAVSLLANVVDGNYTDDVCVYCRVCLFKGETHLEGYLCARAESLIERIDNVNN